MHTKSTSSETQPTTKQALPSDGSDAESTPVLQWADVDASLAELVAGLIRNGQRDRAMAVMAAYNAAHPVEPRHTVVDTVSNTVIDIESVRAKRAK